MDPAHGWFDLNPKVKYALYAFLTAMAVTWGAYFNGTQTLRAAIGATITGLLIAGAAYLKGDAP